MRLAINLSALTRVTALGIFVASGALGCSSAATESGESVETTSSALVSCPKTQTLVCDPPIDPSDLPGGTKVRPHPLCHCEATSPPPPPPPVSRPPNNYLRIFNTGVTGTEIDLPLDTMPTSGGVTAGLGPTGTGWNPYLWLDVFPSANDTSWGDGLDIHNLSVLLQCIACPNPSPPDTHASTYFSVGPSVASNQPILEVTGMFNNNGPGIVRGTVTYQTATQPVQHPLSTPPALVLALQTQDFNGIWSDTQTETLAEAGQPAFPEATVSANVDPNTPVRVQLRVAPNAGGYWWLNVASAHLFGQQCFPDASNPGHCL